MIALAVIASSLITLGLRRVWLQGAQAAGVTTLELTALPAQPQSLSDDKGAGTVVAGYEGSFDPRTRQLVLKTPSDGRGLPERDGRLNTRVDPNAVVTQGSQFTFTVVNSTFIQTGDLAGNISGEIQLMNKLGVTLYNTRVVFTRFAICPASGTCNGTTVTGNANTTPGTTGFAYYNDGLIPYQGKLNVSRAYGDIAPGGTSNAVWAFNVSTTPAKFFFSFVVLADIGVAAESVYPAAVQVNANNGAGIVIRGRNFSNGAMVKLLNGNGAAVATLSNVTFVDATQLTATVPANTPVGVYGVRVTLANGTEGGTGSSAILGRLTVTAPPTTTLSGTVTQQQLSGTGPFLVSSDITLSTAITVQPGAVFYMASGARVLIAAAGNLIANGGVPGVPNGASIPTPTQIVFTAQRSPGAALPNPGAWGGIDATATSSAVLSMRNVVAEFGGAGNKPNVDISNSGRTLRFTDSVSRQSGGTGLAASGNNDSLTGFARNRIEYNGAAVGTPAMIVSANAALGLYEIPATTGGEAVALGTFATDPSYFYTGANVFMGNQSDAIQIPDTANDFTRSGVLVGQGDTPIQIRGSSSNPSIIGSTTSTPAEVTIGPTARIQLAAGMDLQAGDYPTNRPGCLAANGFAGVNQVAGASLANSKYIVFEPIPNNTNFGAIFFARNATASCILNFVQIKNGGTSNLGKGAVIADGVNVSVKNTQITGSTSGTLVELSGGVIFSNGTSANTGSQMIIDTVAGGLGDGNAARKATLVVPTLMALDPQGRGLYIVEGGTDLTLLRFLNTTRNAVTIAGVKIAPGTLKLIAGGGVDFGTDNIPATTADLGIVSGLAVSPGTGDVVYFIDRAGQIVRFINVSANPVVINGMTIGVGRVGTFSGTPQNNVPYGPSLSGLAVRPNGEVLVVDASNNRVYKVASSGGAASVFAGNGAATKTTDAFIPGAATQIPLFQPEFALPDAQGNVYISDTGHGRVIKIDGAGNATLVAQFTAGQGNEVVKVNPYDHPPFPTGLALNNNNLYVALGNAQQIVKVQNTTAYPALVGTIEKSCDYSADSCGDSGPASIAKLYLLSSSASVPPIASIVADANGLFVADQGSASRGRIRYINLSSSAVEVIGVNIAAGSIDTIAGTGLLSPYDGGLATSAELTSPTGVAVDPTNGNLWISDTGNAGRLRYVNRSSVPVTLFSGAGANNTLTVLPGRIATINFNVGGADATDNVPAAQGGFEAPQGLFVTSKGVYVVDSRRGPSITGPRNNPINRRTSWIRFINTTSQDVVFYPNSPENTRTVPPGFIRKIAGIEEDDGTTTVNDGSDPHFAKFCGSADITVAANGDMYIADVGNARVRRILASNGFVSTLEGLPRQANYNLAPSQTTTNQYTGVTLDSTGRLLAVDTIANKLLRETSPGSGISAGGFQTLLTGSPLNQPRDLAFDAANPAILYITNAGDHRVLRVTISGNSATATVLAGTTQGYGGDLGPAASAQLNFASSGIIVSTGTARVTVPALAGITIGLSGEIIFADSGNNAIRRIR
jgi:hypothetical protein